MRQTNKLILMRLPLSHLFFLNRTFRSSRWSTTNTSQIPLIGIYVGKPIVKGGGAD
jgi:hypothetical protein